MRKERVAGFACGVAWLLCGCAGEDDPSGQACVEPLTRQCAPLWKDYDDIYDQLLIKRCGSPDTGTSCHAAAGNLAGLTLEGREVAYEALLGGTDGRARVIPGDPECSPLIERLTTSDPQRRMPPGSRLTDNEACAVVQWVADGAER